MVDYFVRGGAFMWPILIALIIGVMFSIERFYSLSRSKINARKFVQKIVDALGKGDGAKNAIDVCDNTHGPLANVTKAGLTRVDRGIEEVEKAIGASGTIEMAFLERNLVWLSTIVSVAPMLGFLGTVAGMVGAFDAIQKANDISPSLVAGNISVALLTTMFGLIVAIIVQFAHNYFVSVIDKIVVDMEESTQEIVEQLIKSNKTH